MPNISKNMILRYVEQRSVAGIYFNSDTNKNESLFEIEITKIIELFRMVGKCNVTSVEMKFNERKQDYDIFQSDEKIELSDEIKRIIAESENRNLIKRQSKTH